MDPSLTKSERETLKAIFRLTSNQNGGTAHTGDLAETLGVSPGTMTATIKRLADRHLVDHTPYRGVELTQAGRGIAMAVIRRHRIVERFLADLLGYGWQEADRLAPSFEHVLPQEVEDRLFNVLRRPSTCPHGFPIPGPEVLEMPAMRSLYTLEPGDVATVALPGSTGAEIVAFLETLGLRPGVEVEVAEKQPFDGPIVLRVDGADRTVGEKVARQIFVMTNAREADDVARDDTDDLDDDTHGTAEERQEETA